MGERPFPLRHVQNAVFIRLLARDFLHSHHIRLRMRGKSRHHLPDGGVARREHQFVGEDHRERLLPHRVPRAPDRVPQPQRLLLADEADRPRLRQPVAGALQFAVLALAVEFGL
jgi:hypothetical protein